MSVGWLMLNFYLQSLGHSQSVIGAINAASWLTVAIVGIPIGIVSDRVPRKAMLLLGTALAAIGAFGVALSSAALPLIAFTTLSGIGLAAIMTNTSPFLAEHSTAAQRTALFSLQAALSTATGFLGSLLGGYFPALVAGPLGLSPHDVLPLRITLGLVAVLQFVALIPLLLLRSDHLAAEEITDEALPSAPVRPAEVPLGESPAAPPTARSFGRRLQLESPTLFFRLLAPTIFIGLGAGLIMPYLNIFVRGKFRISFEGLGWLFALSSLMTAVGMLLQPLLAERIGKVRSVVLVQALSLPFLLMMGYAPYFPLVAVALLVRGMLMNMANPVYMAFCMDQLPRRERATFSGSAEVIWSLTWAVSSGISGWLRDLLGFQRGFDVEFALMALLYFISTAMLYAFFGRRPERPAESEPEEQPAQEVAP
jgi:MFS family permease